MFVKKYSLKHDIEPEEYWEKSLAVDFASAIEPPTIAAEQVKDLDFVIIARNFRNYYHFITEALIQLELVDQLKHHRGKIVLVSFGKEQSGFCEKLIEDFYPDLKPRVSFVFGKYQSEKAILPLQSYTQYFYGPMSEEIDVTNVLPNRDQWGVGPNISNFTQAVILQNSFESTLLRFHKRVTKLIKDDETPDLPKRVWIGRNEDSVRSRTMANGDLLFSRLKQIGFKEVFLEDLQPIEQAALFRSAEIVVGQHGAGFTNMMFSTSKTLFIEIGNFLSVKNRSWDWDQFTFVFGCRYLKFIGDIHEDEVVNVKENFASILPISLSEKAVDVITDVIRLNLNMNPEYADTYSLLNALVQCDEWKHVERMIAQLREDQYVDVPQLLLCLADWQIYNQDYDDAIESLQTAGFLDVGKQEILLRKIEIARLTKDNDLTTKLLMDAGRLFPDRIKRFEKASQFGYCP